MLIIQQSKGFVTILFSLKMGKKQRYKSRSLFHEPIAAETLQTELMHFMLS